MKPSILITGASGYLGRSLIKKLGSRGIRSMGVDRQPLPAEFAKICRFRKMDLSDARSCRALLTAWKPTHVIHAAALVQVKQGMPGAENKSLLDANVIATQSLLEASVQTGVRQFIFLSTMCVYDACKKGQVRESDPLRPSSYYGLTKLMAEQLVLAYASWSSMKTVVLRPMGLFGEDRRGGLIYQWIQKALRHEPIEVPRGLSVPWNVVCVSDLSELLTRMVVSGRQGPNVTLNVGNDRPIRLERLARQILELTASRSVLRSIPEGKDIPFAYDLSRLKRTTGWTPEPFEKRLREYVTILKKENAR